MCCSPNQHQYYHWNDSPNSYYKYSIGIRIGDLYVHNDLENISVMGIFAMIGYDLNEYTGSRTNQ